MVERELRLQKEKQLQGLEEARGDETQTSQLGRQEVLVGEILVELENLS